MGKQYAILRVQKCKGAEIGAMQYHNDKAAEMHLSGVLTRIELTCDGEWDAGQVVAHWPQVHAWHSDEDTRDWVRVVGIMLAEKAERGEDVETLINMLGRGSRPKVREFLRAPMVELPPDCAAATTKPIHIRASRRVNGAGGDYGGGVVPHSGST